tara:strand:+ start:803 stop:1333 length:531 start_codon:yes stop_codon:yes gene_type:complete
MDKFVSNHLSLILFICIPIVFLWHPNWLGILGVQPYWPLFWLLPWSMIHGPINGLLAGLFLGLILDSVSIGNSFTQIPSLILCGLWFGRISISNNVLVGHFRHGLIASIGTFACGVIHYIQISFNNFPSNNFFFFYPSLKNILAQVFLTGLFAPLICSRLLKLFKNAKQKKNSHQI